MLPPVYTTLRASGSVVAIVADRIFRHGHAKQDKVAVTPKVAYVTWFVVFGDPENELTETPSTDRVTIQVDCYHPTDMGVVDLAQAVRDAIEPVAHMTGVPVDLKEPETGLYRMALQFDWFLSR